MILMAIQSLKELWELFTQKCGRDIRRSRIRHTHFKKYYSGNPADLDSVLNAVPDVLNEETWKQVVELFISPKFQARSQQNKKNRNEMKYLSTQGSKSMAAIRNKRVSTQNYTFFDVAF